MHLRSGVGPLDGLQPAIPIGGARIRDCLKLNSGRRLFRISRGPRLALFRPPNLAPFPAAANIVAEPLPRTSPSRILIAFAVGQWNTGTSLTFRRTSTKLEAGSFQYVYSFKQFGHESMLPRVRRADHHCPIEALVDRLAAGFREEYACMTSREIRKPRTLTAQVLGANGICRAPRCPVERSLQSGAEELRPSDPDKAAQCAFGIASSRIDQDSRHRRLGVARDINTLAQGRGAVTAFKDQLID